MHCEPHFCLNPYKIECRKTIELNACSRDDEWVAGFVERKNDILDWLEVECCHYQEDVSPVFIKNIVTSDQWDHDVIVIDGKLTAVEYVKEISRDVNAKNETLYKASIYRLKCDQDYQFFTENFTEPLEIGSTGKFEGVPPTCDKSTDHHLMFCDMGNKLRKMCLPKECVENEKIECQKNVPIDSCAGENEWVADMEFNNETKEYEKIECCRYKENLDFIFFKNVQFEAEEFQFFNEVEEFRRFAECYFLNNITVHKNNSENGTFYSAVIYNAGCPITKKQHALQRLEEDETQTLQQLQAAAILLNNMIQIQQRILSKTNPSMLVPRQLDNFMPTFNLETMN